MRVTKLRRYPVKAMAGEALDTVEVDDRGLVGDRWYAVVDDEGRFASGKAGRRFRRRDEVLAHAASTTAEGVRVSGPGGTWAVGDPALDAALSEEMGARALYLLSRLVSDDSPRREREASRTSAVAEADLHQILVCPDVEGGTAAPPRTSHRPETDNRTDPA